MARRRSRRRTLVEGAEPILDRFKYEVANELGIVNKLQSNGWEEMTTREVGTVGGLMVKKMLQEAEKTLASRGQIQ